MSIQEDFENAVRNVRASFQYNKLSVLKRSAQEDSPLPLLERSLQTPGRLGRYFELYLEGMESLVKTRLYSPHFGNDNSGSQSIPDRLLAGTAVIRSARAHGLPSPWHIT